MSTFRPDLFSGRVAVVTGGTSGLGAATARFLARLGATVHAVGIGSDDAEFSSDLDVSVREVDVTRDDALRALYSDLERLDVLVPAAGITLGEEELEWENFNRVLDVQLQGVYRTVHLGRELLAATDDSSVVTVASMFSYFGGGRRAAYATAKGGVVQLTKSLAEAWAPDGVRVNAVAPGWIETPLLNPLKADQALNDRILSRTPMGRYGTGEEVGQAVAFLASDAASFVNGAVLPVDGGYLVTGI